MFRLEMLDDEIGRKLAEAERSGELQAAKGYGQPLEADAGWDETPDTLRMPFKILKDAGVVPHEVEMLKQRAALREQLERCTDPAEAQALKRSLALLEQSIALRLEALRRSA
jgi:Domain of unknown function (DUF1992)